MGLAQDTPKAIWLKLSAGDGGTGFLQYATKEKDANGRTVYRDVKNGLENVYFVDAKFKLETNPQTQKVSKKLHASFEDAATGERFVITAGWATALSRNLIYNVYKGDYDYNKPMLIKTFKGDEPLQNGYYPIVVLISQVPNPQKGEFLGQLGADCKNELVQKTLQKQDDAGRTYMTYNWAEVLDPIIEPLGEKLRQAAATRASAAPVGAYVGEEIYDDEEYDHEEAYSAPQTPPVMSFGTTQQPAPQATPANAMGTVIQNPGAAPNPDDIPF